jgi:hypothetical protein
MMTSDLSIAPTGASDSGDCECCGRPSRCVSGYAYKRTDRVAAYFVQWTPGHAPEQGANIDLILGEWGDAGDAERRLAVALTYRLLPTGPTVSVIDAAGRAFAQDKSFVGRLTSRDDVVGTEVAEVAFAIASAVLAQDQRVAELLGEWTPPSDLP